MPGILLNSCSFSSKMMKKRKSTSSAANLQSSCHAKDASSSSRIDSPSENNLSQSFSTASSSSRHRSFHFDTALSNPLWNKENTDDKTAEWGQFTEIENETVSEHIHPTPSATKKCRGSSQRRKLFGNYLELTRPLSPQTRKHERFFANEVY